MDIYQQDFSTLNNATLNYLSYKNWVSEGTAIFNGITVYHDNGVPIL